VWRKLGFDVRSASCQPFLEEALSAIAIRSNQTGHQVTTTHGLVAMTRDRDAVIGDLVITFQDYVWIDARM
jgi:hypothetical protein